MPTLGPPLPSVWPLNVGFQLLGHYAARNSRLGHISLSFCISAHLLISLFCSGLLRESAIHYMNLGGDVRAFLLDLNKCNSSTVHITVCHSTDINVGTTSEKHCIYIFHNIYQYIILQKILTWITAWFKNAPNSTLSSNWCKNIWHTILYGWKWGCIWNGEGPRSLRSLPKLEWSFCLLKVFRKMFCQLIN